MQENNTNTTTASAPSAQNAKGGFASFFIHRPVLTIMASLALIIVGLMSYSSMGVGMYPNVEVPYVLVQTTLAGASPEEMETSVSKVIEESVNQIEGIDELKSQSMEGTSLVVIKFDLEKTATSPRRKYATKWTWLKTTCPTEPTPPLF